jgi:carbon-monoxide dehydrogenase medium subunit
VKSSEFQYHRPETLDAALALLAHEDSVPLAGGQSLMPMMNFRIAGPEVLVDLNAVAGLSGVSVDEGWVTIGAMTRYSSLETDPEVMRHVPLLGRVLPHIAHPAIRNRGTIGGSCALADPAAELPAVLLALGGAVTVQSAKGTRRIAADDFFLGLYETARDEHELITGVHFPCSPAHQKTGFYEITRRHGDYAIAGCVVSASKNLGAVRVAFFGISDRPLRVEGIELALMGGDGGAGALDGAVAALDGVQMSGDLHADEATKRHLARVALRRAWTKVIA